jgi:DNA/RNA-binding domain of Phe-tRNA-synthetase-like protein
LSEANRSLVAAKKRPMTRVGIDRELKTKCPRVALACVIAAVETVATPEGLDQELRSCEEKILKLAEPKAVLESAAITATRAAYKALGKDPARYRGSAEALLRRVIAGKGLPRINNVVDVINSVSVLSRLPVGLYDLAHVEGDILFRAGRAGETYKGIGKYDLNLEGLPVFCDALGPHGSPTSDSERTMVTETTKKIILILVSFGGADGLERWAERASEQLKQYASGAIMETSLV